MENKQQLLANFLAFKSIPFAEFKSVITTANSMDFLVKNTPLEQLQSMFVSANFSEPKTVNEASNVLKKIYKEFESVKEEDFAGDYKSKRELEQLQRLQDDLSLDQDEQDNDDDASESNADSVGGFFDDASDKKLDLGKLLNKVDQNIDSLANDPKNIDELLGLKKPKQSDDKSSTKENSDTSDNQNKGSEDKNPQSSESSSKSDSDSSDNNDTSDNTGEDDKSGEDQKNKEQNPNANDKGEGQTDDKSSNQSSSDAKEKSSDGQGNPDNQQQKQQQQQQQQETQKDKQDKQNNDLEREIQLCLEEKKSLEDEKEMISLVNSKSKSDIERVNSIDLIIEDLKRQVTRMTHAISASEILETDVEYPIEMLPRYLSSGLEQYKIDLNANAQSIISSADYSYPHKLDDKSRRNNLIIERVVADGAYYGFEKAKKDNTLKELYLTKEDILDVSFEFTQNDVPQKVVLKSKTDLSEVVIDDATSIGSMCFQFNTLERNVEITNKEENLKLIFETTKTELFNKFII